MSCQRSIFAIRKYRSSSCARRIWWCCCFPATQGGLSRGVPTGYAAYPLNEQIRPGSDPPPVWPWKKGTARGIAFHPLYPSVPDAAERIPALGELLALFDAVRGGSAREQAVALTLLEERLHP